MQVVVVRVALLLLLWRPSFCNADNPQQAPRYAVNLDLPAEERWNEVVADFEDEIRTLTANVRRFAPWIGASEFKIIENILAKVNKHLSYPYGEEMAGIAKAAGVPLTHIMMANFMYELNAFNPLNRTFTVGCTTILAQSKSGTVYLARNTDADTDLLRKLTIIVDFKVNGETVYTGTTFAGYVGLISGQKPNSFTMATNERDTGDWWMNGLEALVTGIDGAVLMLIRDTIADPEMDFKTAVEMTAHRRMIASTYIMFGGLEPNEAAVMTMDRTSANSVWWLGTNHTWYLVETNYDHWKAPPPGHNWRTAAINAMNNVGQDNISPETLLDVLSVDKVLNKCTVHTSIMSASDPGLYNTLLRYPAKSAHDCM